MRFSCSSTSLQKGIGIVERAISQRTTLPVLENLYLELTGNMLRLRGNDLEVGIETVVPVESVGTDGSVLIRAKTFSSILSKIQSEVIDITVENSNRMIVRANKVDFEILCSPVDDYPVFPSVESGAAFTVKSATLKDLIRHTLFSVSFDETKQFLNGIFVKVEAGVLFFVATDGYRLALKKCTLDGANLPDFSLIVPYKAMNELSKILTGMADEDDIQVNVSDSQVAFSSGRFLLVSRVIKGQFPDYRQVLPKHSDNLFSVSRFSLLNACDRATIIASTSNNVVRLQFTDDSLVIRANAASLGDFREQVDVARLQGSGDVKIAFNVKLVLDGIRGIDSDDVRLEFNQGISPCVIRSATDEDYVYIVMPIRTNDFQDDPV